MPFRPLRGYFYLYLHSTLILQTITSYCVPPNFVRLRITSIRLRLRSPSFSGLISRTSTSLRFVRPRSFDISLFQLAFYQFRSDLVHSFVIYIGPRIRTHPIIYIHYPIIFGSDIDSYISLYHYFGHIGTVYLELRIRLLFVVFVLVLVHIDIASISPSHMLMARTFTEFDGALVCPDYGIPVA